MATHGPPRASLLGLPAELRNTVYFLVLPIDQRQDIWFFYHPTSGPPLTRSAVPAVLQTCRLLRKEGVPIYYGTCKFLFIVQEQDQNGALESFVGFGALHLLLQWLDRLDDRARKCLIEDTTSNNLVAYAPAVSHGHDDTQRWRHKMTQKYGVTLHEVCNMVRHEGTDLKTALGAELAEVVRRRWQVE